MSELRVSYHEGICLRLYVSETAQWQGKPFYLALFALFQREGIRGATAMRGIEGFGPSHYLASERLPDLSEDLPIIIEVVDEGEKIQKLLPLLDSVLERGTLLQFPVKILEVRSQP